VPTRRQCHNEQILSQGHTPHFSASVTAPKVILVEDDFAMRTLLAGRFRAAGFEVVEATNGAQLWKEIAESILDAHRPRLRGHRDVNRAWGAGAHPAPGRLCREGQRSQTGVAPAPPPMARGMLKSGPVGSAP
jgi:hypothetical protein